MKGAKYDATAKAIKALADEIHALDEEITRTNEFLIRQLGTFSVDLEKAIKIVDPNGASSEIGQTVATNPRNKLYDRAVVKNCNMHGHEVVAWLTPDGRVAAGPLCKKCGLTREEIRSAPC